MVNQEIVKHLKEEGIPKPVKQELIEIEVVKVKVQSRHGKLMLK